MSTATFIPRSHVIEQHQRARWKLRNAIKCGQVEKKTTCDVCGSDDRVEAHHPDYSEPLNVRWLCKKCHYSHHGGRQGAPR